MRLTVSVFMIILMTFLGLIASPILAQDLNQTVTFEAKIVKLNQAVVSDFEPEQQVLSQTIIVEGLQDEFAHTQFEAQLHQIIDKNNKPYQVGDTVLVSASTDLQGETTYVIIDYVRKDSLVLLLFLFMSLVVVVGRKHGIASLIGLASSFFIIFTFFLPLIQKGYEPIIVAIVGSAAIIFITFSITHGLNKKTIIAMIGTTISLVITAVLATIFLSLARLNGFGSEEASFLQYVYDGQLNMAGLLLAGIIIGTLGVLDDITISQASVVHELRSLHPKISSIQLFKRAMNVGHDHIASLVNTLILVYVGSSLPLLMLFNQDPGRSFTTVINYSLIAEEIVATLVGSIGIVLAVPITTFIASFYGHSFPKLTFFRKTA